MIINPSNTLRTQWEYATADPKKYKHPAIIGGFGSGKTAAIPLRWIYLIHWRAKYQNRKCNMMIVEPTHEMVKDILIPALDEFFNRHSIRHSYHKTDKIYTIYLIIDKKKISFRALLRSSDKPESLTGKTLTDIIIDEYDKTASIDNQRDIWNECIARIRQVEFATCGIVTTPEGFKHTYELYHECEIGTKENFLLIKAKTYNNIFLPADYINNLYSQYSKELIEQYIEGNFINLTQGKVYYSFDRDVNIVDYTYKKGYPIKLCVDFNVNPMKWCLVQTINDRDYVFDEIVGNNTNTSIMTNEVAKRYGRDTFYIIFGDYFGNSRDTRSMTTDYEIIKELLPNSQVLVKPNPPIIDTIHTLNGRLRNSKGESRLFVSSNCKHLIQDLENVVWCTDKREIDKKSNPDLTHISDALRYQQHYEYGIGSKPNIYHYRY